MTLKAGSLVIVCNHDRMESYAAVLLEDYPPHRRVSPLVRVVQMLRYPAQTAIMDSSIANDMPPAAAGEVDRIPFVCAWPEGAPEPNEALYTRSARLAREAYAKEVRAQGRDDILRLLEAHKRGIYTRKRHP